MARKVVSMEQRLLAVFTVGLASVNVSSLCTELSISRQTFYKYRRRFAAEGPAGLVERSRRPDACPGQTPADVEQAIVLLRKELDEEGLDCGAQSIAYRLGRQGCRSVPSPSTIHRVLWRRGMITAQPQKRPRSATRRFVWPRPNDAWQIDATLWMLSSGEEVWIMDLLDDHSRLVPAALTWPGPTAQAAWDTFCMGAEQFGLPAHVMSDNGTCFTGRFQGGEAAFERDLRALGIGHIRSTPGHPQTCGKLERFHQTLKRWLAARPLAGSPAELQTQLDLFLNQYNTSRPHRALEGATPIEVWHASEPATPGVPIPTLPSARILRVDTHGRISLGQYVIQISSRLAGRPVLVIARDHNLSIFEGGQLVHRLQLDPTRRYQPNHQPPGPKPKTIKSSN